MNEAFGFKNFKTEKQNFAFNHQSIADFWLDWVVDSKNFTKILILSLALPINWIYIILINY
jgi:hypothetical protein